MSDDHFHLDWETRSQISLDDAGLANYVEHPSTEIILGSFARGDRKVQVWEPHKSTLPAELEDALLDPFTTIEAHNAIFEKLIAQNSLKIDKPIEEFRCTMARCRYLSLPGGLDAAGEILGLSESQAKLKDGKRLIHKFCEPESAGGEETLFGTSQPLFRDWATDPADWQNFVDYGKRDVEAERTIGKKLKKFPLPDFEWETWFLSERINANGLPTDEKLIAGARFLVDKETRRLIDQLRELTGLENPNSTTQLLPWLQARGYVFDSLGKPFVARAFAGEGILAEEARLALEIRGQTSKSSVKKYTVIADTVSPDGRLRHAYQFLGAARTGRFSALGVNLLNLSKPSKQVEAELPAAIELVQKMDYDGIVAKFGKPLDVVSGVLRSSFRAPEGMKFVVADLNAIEPRGVAYLSHCKPMLEVFEKGLDPYIEFATCMYGGTYEELWHEYKVLKNSIKRTNSKPPFIGGGYGLGPGEEKIDPVTGILTWTGLMGYSRSMGVEMTHDEAVTAVKTYRANYKEVTWLWRDMQNAAAKAIRNPGQVIGVGVPQSDRDREYFDRIGREIHESLVSFRCHGTKVLEMMLPSGRSLHYIDPTAREEDAEYQGKPYKRTVIEYQGKEQGSQQWGVITTHGGKWTEQSTQSISRDVLVHGMKLAEKRGFEIVLSTYDEIGALVDENSPLGVKELCECMATQPDWCKGQFPLAAEGFESIVYRK
jgi:DNA polymerase